MFLGKHDINLSTRTPLNSYPFPLPPPPHTHTHKLEDLPWQVASVYPKWEVEELQPEQQSLTPCLSLEYREVARAGSKMATRMPNAIAPRATTIFRS